MMLRSLTAIRGAVLEMLMMMPVLLALPCAAINGGFAMCSVEVGLAGTLGADRTCRDQLL
jgi:hypothetical protein